MRKLVVICTAVILFTTSSAIADTTSNVIINPVSDGQVYWNGVVLPYFLEANVQSQGVVKFPTSQITTPFTHASLSVNPYGLPLWCPEIAVYGYQSSTGQITSSDLDAGTFLGNWVLPADLGYGQDAFYDVTQFTQTVSSPFICFNLRSTNGGTDQFSSLINNYGHPSQLIVTIPEPATILLLGFGGLMLKKKR